MTDQDVAAVRSTFEEFLRTGELDWNTIDPAVEVHDHDIPDADTYRGRAGYVKWLEDWGQAWAEVSISPERWIDAGDKVVLVLLLTAKGRGSGVEVKRRDGMVWTIRGGKTARIDYFNNEAEALEFAGLPAAK
jgi:ketosteroid isomerase-like protein